MLLFCCTEYMVTLLQICIGAVISALCPLGANWLIDLHRVRDLDLIDEPFVPHNLISTQENPVPLLKFQMAPRLNSLMSSGSKKGTQIYFLFSLKSPQQGPYGERYLFTGHFAYLSNLKNSSK